MFKQFYPYHLIISYFKDHLHLDISTQFIDCADLQLPKDFSLQTGIKVNKNIGLGFNLYPDFYYEADKLSVMSANVIINNYGNPATIKWESNSGRIYTLSDTDIDCDDIEFWFEGLDPLEYQKQLHANNELPFQLKNLTYELVVTALNMDMTIEMSLKEEQYANATKHLDNIDKMIDDYNNKSIKKDREDGVVHNWRRRIESDKLIYEIDTGSAGVLFLKKLLKHLSTLNCFNKVEIL